MRSELVLTALRAALRQRELLERMLFHSDRGGLNSARSSSRSDRGLTFSVGIRGTMIASGLDVLDASPIPILGTKLHPPPVGTDIVPRPGLIERLEASRDLPLTLVSAPAGYGKSTLIADALRTSETPHAWLSLDEHDSDLRTFLCYLVAAIRVRVPGACGTSLANLSEVDLPAPRVLADTLINDLSQLDRRLVVAIDDFHYITDPAIHQVLGRFFAYPPSGVQLILMTRWDPPLNVSVMRAKSRLTEIRARDLALDVDDVGAFFRGTDLPPIDDVALRELYSSTEGWPVGVRLTSLAMRVEDHAGALLNGLAELSSDVHEFLVDQILAGQDPLVREQLEQTSILDRMCAPLCRALFESQDRRAGATFIEHITRCGLMVIPLDARGEWSRYHHLFQSLLRSRLERSHASEEILALHRRAGAWFAAQGHIEEALTHYEAAGDQDAAAQLVCTHIEEALNHEQWFSLSGWLTSLPREAIDARPRLLLAQAWWIDFREHIEQAFELIDRAEAMLRAAPEDPGSRALLGEVYAINARRHYFVSDMAATLEAGLQALERLPAQATNGRSYAVMFCCAALQLHGQRSEARALLASSLANLDSPGSGYHGRLLVTQCWLDWHEGDLAALGRAAARYLEFADAHDLGVSKSFARYFQALAHYFQDELDAVESVLEPVLDAKVRGRPQVDAASMFMLAMVAHHRGKTARAQEIVEMVISRAQANNAGSLVALGQAFTAELDLRRGEISKALEWANTFDPGPGQRATAGPPPFLFFDPRFTLARVLAASDRPETMDRARALLDQWLEHMESFRGCYSYKSEALLTRAHLALRREDNAAAQRDLARALELACPRKFKRFTVPIDHSLFRLASRLDLDDEKASYLRELALLEGADIAMNAASPSPAASELEPLLNPLSERELEVLRLIAVPMTNKEIGKQLFISAGTVGRHAENIYRKLDVRGRRQAVARARALGLL